MKSASVKDEPLPAHRDWYSKPKKTGHGARLYWYHNGCMYDDEDGNAFFLSYHGGTDECLVFVYQYGKLHKLHHFPIWSTDIIEVQLFSIHHNVGITVNAEWYYRLEFGNWELERLKQSDLRLAFDDTLAHGQS